MAYPADGGPAVTVGVVEPAPPAPGDRPSVFSVEAWRRMLVDTVVICFRYRVTGLAAEAGFFALLSLPPLVLGLFGAFGYLTPIVSPEVVEGARQEVIDLAGLALTTESVRQVIVPTLEDVLLRGGRADIVSMGFLLALWSGSRALYIYVDTVSTLYGLGGRRGIIVERLLSFGLYVVGLFLGIVMVPLILAGPQLVDQLLPERLDWLNAVYWPLVVVLFVGFIATLYTVSVPARIKWRRSLPGALLALILWVLLSYLLRQSIAMSVGGTSIYGPLSAPIVVLLWLYLLSLAVLIGAALNAAVDSIWPLETIVEARLEEEARHEVEGHGPDGHVGSAAGSREHA